RPLCSTLFPYTTLFRSQRLAHLFPTGGHPRVVQPQAGEVPAGRVGLGDLVLVVREAQVDAAAVDVEGLAEVLARHRRAFQMPSGPATAPGGVPAGAGRIGVLGRLPQREIAGVALIGGLVLLDRGQLVQALVGEPAVLWPG